jgi:hypothetical protein
MHLDLLQRIQVDPASLTVIRYTPLRPFLLRMNDSGGGVDNLIRKNREPGHAGSQSARSARREAEAAVGGGGGG